MERKGVVEVARSQSQIWGGGGGGGGLRGLPPSKVMRCVPYI